MFHAFFHSKCLKVIKYKGIMVFAWLLLASSNLNTDIPCSKYALTTLSPINNLLKVRTFETKEGTFFVIF